MMRKFVILTTPRTGSNMLVSALSSHPDIQCFSELFRRRTANSIHGLEVLNHIDEKFSSESYRFSHASEYLNAVYSTAVEVGYVGFKLMLRQNIELRDALIADELYRKILLYRENVLASFSSECIAKVTGQVIATGNDEIKTVKVEFDPEKFQRYRDRRSRLYSETRTLLQAAGQDFCEVEYLSAMTVATMKGLIGYIGADTSFQCSPKTVKRNPGNILQRFSNPTLVSSYLQSIGREYWENEDRVRN